MAFNAELTQRVHTTENLTPQLSKGMSLSAVQKQGVAADARLLACL